MGQQVLPIQRDHDLPPLWGGLDVEWHGWQSMPDPICLRSRIKPDVCVACGSREPRPMNRGTLRTRPGMVASISHGNLARGRHIVANIYAFRCPDCRLDQVLDGFTDGKWWDLDESDYRNEGSYSS